MSFSKISACVVTYNSSKDIRSVLTSLLNSSIKEKIDVYVVDNNSSDNTTLIIDEEYPEVQLLKLKENIGFGAGHNQVISKIESEYHIIINPDITFEADVIERLLKYMDENSDVVISTPRILNHDGTEQHLPKLDPKIKYFIGGRLENLGGFFSKLRAKYTRQNECILEPTDIEFCTGCFMFTRTSVLKSVNGFDQRYFLHFEDADLTRSMRKYGRVVFHPKFVVRHLWKRDNVRSYKVFLIALVSMFKYFHKWGY